MDPKGRAVGRRVKTVVVLFGAGSAEQLENLRECRECDEKNNTIMESGNPGHPYLHHSDAQNGKSP